MEEKVAPVAASVLMSLPCGNHISTAKPSSSILRTRSSNGRSRKTISAQTASGDAGSGDGARFSGLLIISRPPQDVPAGRSSRTRWRPVLSQEHFWRPHRCNPSSSRCGRTRRSAPARWCRHHGTDRSCDGRCRGPRPLRCGRSHSSGGCRRPLPCRRTLHRFPSQRSLGFSEARLQELQALSDVGDGSFTLRRLLLDHDVLLQHIPSLVSRPVEKLQELCHVYVAFTQRAERLSRTRFLEADLPRAE